MRAWTTKSSIPTTQRFFSGAAAIDGVLYVFGGEDGGGIVKPVAAYAPASDSWTTVAPMPTARAAAVGGVIYGVLYAVGGQTPSSIVGTTEAFIPHRSSHSR